MFEDENERNEYENNRQGFSAKDALTGNSAVKAAIFVVGLMICIIVIYVLIFAGSTGTGNETPTVNPDNTSAVTLKPGETPNPGVTTPEPTVAPTPTPQPFSFQKGSEDPKIKELQQLLIEKGYLAADTELSETFGAKTDKAVRDFQERMGMEINGVVDNALWMALEQAPVKEEAFSFKKGDKSPKIKELQQLLIEKGYLAADTVLSENFGPKTEVAVKLFQKVNNMTETGIVNNTLFDMIKKAEKYTGTLS